jgi:cell fate (sporulation/competence/biofilm development) regulator YmcA (YheA/YmcA/DUF963 family)
LNSLKKLINELQKDESIIRFKILLRFVDQDKNMQNDYKNLLELQKKMVNDREKNKKNLEISTKNYELAKTNLTSNIVISEYLELLEDINSDLQMIKNIIEFELSRDFE